MPSLYIVVFPILSMTISYASWPSRYRRVGLWLAFGALLLSLALSWQLLSVSGSWFALTQKLELLVRTDAGPVLSRMVAGWLAPVVALLAVAGDLGFPALPHGLGVGVVYLFFYLLIKGCLLPPLYLLQRGRPTEHGYGRGRPQYQWLCTTSNATVWILVVPLMLLPLGLERLPASSSLVSQPLWVGGWIVLLELRLWFNRRRLA